ncbi:hypothetical protein L0244_15790 [bacterium]|nr:hypothetical protein [bacterium]MCI0614448.1 hypothetical protein [bacterium]
MRPQIILYCVFGALLLFCSSVLADQLSSPLDYGNKMRESFAHVRTLSRLTSSVVELSYGDLLNVADLRTQGFPKEQLACQRAITHGSIAYVRKWIDATERGMTPEAANQIAARKLEEVISVCNVPVVENAAGTRIPSVGGPCSFSTSHVFVDPNEVRGCLQQTLEFWSSYLYIPANR